MKNLEDSIWETYEFPSDEKEYFVLIRNGRHGECRVYKARPTYHPFGWETDDDRWHHGCNGLAWTPVNNIKTTLGKVK